MRDCTTCKFDKNRVNCAQGHIREWNPEIGKTFIALPIEDCHAFKEKELKKCKCSSVI